MTDMHTVANDRNQTVSLVNEPKQKVAIDPTKMKMPQDAHRLAEALVRAKEEIQKHRAALEKREKTLNRWESRLAALEAHEIKKGWSDQDLREARMRFYKQERAKMEDMARSLGLDPNTGRPLNK